MWDTDRLHMSSLGHRYMAARVLEALGVDHTLRLKQPEPLVPAGWRQVVRRERDWLQEWVIPMFGRKFKGITLGDNLPPRWPEPVRVARGLKKLARERSAASAG